MGEAHRRRRCFNLIVADFNTYFVGDAKVLVHDNMLRALTRFAFRGCKNKLTSARQDACHASSVFHPRLGSG